MGIFGHMLAGGVYGGATARAKTLEDQETARREMAKTQQRQDFQRELLETKMGHEEGLLGKKWEREDEVTKEKREYEESLVEYDETFTDADGTVYAYSSQDPNNRVELGSKANTYEKIVKLGDDTVVGVKADGKVDTLKQLSGAAGKADTVDSKERRLTVQAADKILAEYGHDWQKVPELQKDLVVTMLNGAGLEITKEEVEKKTWFGLKTDIETQYGIGESGEPLSSGASGTREPTPAKGPTAKEAPSGDNAHLRQRAETALNQYAQAFGPEKATEKLQELSSVAKDGPEAVSQWLDALGQEAKQGPEQTQKLLDKPEASAASPGLLDEPAVPPAKKEPGPARPKPASLYDHFHKPTDGPTAASQIAGQAKEYMAGAPERVQKEVLGQDMGNPFKSAQASAQNIKETLGPPIQAIKNRHEPYTQEAVFSRIKSLGGDAKAKQAEAELKQQAGEDYTDPRTGAIKPSALPALADICAKLGFTEEQVRQILGVK